MTTSGSVAEAAPRSFASPSSVASSGLSLALAPALTPRGTEVTPAFFRGFTTHPQTLAQSLVTLADITASRYFQFVPSDLRDPVLTAHGDRLRAEVFSSDNSVYARLDLLESGLDGGQIGYGTTNVDISQSTRQALSMVRSSELMHLNVGQSGLTVSTPSTSAVERPVVMPDRWVRALGNAAEMHKQLVPRFEIPTAAARAFIASLPPVTGTGRSVWVTPGPSGVRLAARPSGDAVWVDGLNRLTALKRLLTHQRGLRFYGPSDGSPGAAAVEVSLPGSRLLLTLTPTVTRGYSGEGALLTALSTPDALDDAALISALLSFEPVIDVAAVASAASLSEDAVRAALAVLASAGRVGWDVHDAVYFHRELPDDPSRVQKDNPRLRRALGIVERPGSVQRTERSGTASGSSPAAWLVDGGNGVHRVSESGNGRTCTCTWFLQHGASRGPCAHVLAVGLAEHEVSVNQEQE